MGKEIYVIYQKLTLDGSGSMFLQQPFFFAHPNLKYHYNDISHGFTPTGGTTYFLRSLVPSFAKYLSLTGQSMNSDELKLNNFIFNITEKKDELYQAAFHHNDIHRQDIVTELNLK